MIFKIAIRNLLHDRVRFAVTLVGIVFAVVLIAVQMGLYAGSRKMITGVIEHANGDLWIMARGAVSFEQAPLLTSRERFTALTVPGVTGVESIVSFFVEWKKPSGTTTNVVLVGSDPGKALSPWNVNGGVDRGVFPPHGVIADRTYLSELGIGGVGGSAEINGKKARVFALTSGIRSFTTSPYIFATLADARDYASVAADQATFHLVTVERLADAPRILQDLKDRLPTASVMTAASFIDANLDYWLFGTGAGVALLGGAALGLFVGTIVVAQTLYSSTKDHLSEFATLRALGSSSRYIVAIILVQALVSGALGYFFGMTIALALVILSGETALPIYITPELGGGLLAVTLAMCVLSALSSIAQVLRIDPVIVFSR